MGQSQARKQKRSTAADFKKGKKADDLELPSGNVALVKRKALDAFLAEGLIPNSLMTIVQDQLDTAEDKKAKDLNSELQKVASDPDALKDVIRLSDAIVIACVVEPKVLSNIYSQADSIAGKCAPELIGTVIPEDKRNDDDLYIDDVDTDDKMFIFQWAVGGTASIEQFRSERSALVADLSGGETVGDDA
jgi:hypothetical protein